MVELIKPQIKWTEEKKQYLIEHYPYGDKKKICNDLGCTYKSLKSMARLLGIKSLQDKNHYKLKKLTDENNYNYYWWGYILADGHISKKGQLSVIIKDDDSNHLKKLSEYLNINLKHRYIKTEYSEGIYYTITCQDAKYGEVLKNKIGVTENKTYKCIDYSWINTKEKFISVFSGFYDGDGCMSFNKKHKQITMKIECHYNWIGFLEFCSLKLKEYFDIESKTYITSKGSSAIRIYRNDQIIKLYKITKEFELPILERKWIK
jgi:hypothetical protein